MRRVAQRSRLCPTSGLVYAAAKRARPYHCGIAARRQEALARHRRDVVASRRLSPSLPRARHSHARLSLRATLRISTQPAEATPAGAALPVGWSRRLTLARGRGSADCIAAVAAKAAAGAACAAPDALIEAMRYMQSIAGARCITASALRRAQGLLRVRLGGSRNEKWSKSYPQLYKVLT